MAFTSRRKLSFLKTKQSSSYLHGFFFFLIFNWIEAFRTILLQSVWNRHFHFYWQHKYPGCRCPGSLVVLEIGDPATTHRDLRDFSLIGSQQTDLTVCSCGLHSVSNKLAHYQSGLTTSDKSFFFLGIRNIRFSFGKNSSVSSSFLWK